MAIECLGADLHDLQKGQLGNLYSIKHPLWEKGKDDIDSPPLTEFLVAIGQVHYNAAHKHPPFGWEKSPTHAVDSTPQCNLDAIIRHLLRITMSGEESDTESMLPHSWHIACRWQMFVTSTLRLKMPSESTDSKLSFDQVNPVIVDPKLGEDTERKIGPNASTITPKWCRDVATWNRFVTPESVYVLMRIDPTTVEQHLKDYWEMGKTVNMTHHRAMLAATLSTLAHIEYHKYDADPSRIIQNDIDSMTAHALAYFAVWQKTIANPPKKSTR